MRSFKKMLAAVSAVTIAFGAMALTAGAVSEPVVGTNYSVGSFDTFAEGGYFRVSFEGDPTGVSFGITFCTEPDGSGWLGSVGSTAWGDGYWDFAYDGTAYPSAAYLKIEDWGNASNLTFTDISYIAPKKITAVECPVPDGDSNIITANDGWYARAFTFTNDSSDTSVTYVVNVGDEEVARSGSMSGPVKCGIIAGSQDQAKLAAMATPLITVE